MKMNKTIIKLQGKLLLSIVTVGIALGNLALMSNCQWGVYEPKKPDILKNEK